MNDNNIRLGMKKERLQMYYDAEEKILAGQSYSLGSRSLTRANLSEVRAAIKELEAEVLSLSNRGTTRRAVYRPYFMD